MSVSLDNQLSRTVTPFYDSHTEIPTALPTQPGKQDKWNEIIDRKLIEWGRTPAVEDNDGYVSPTREVVLKAIKLSQHLDRIHFPAPEIVVADASGGIAFRFSRPITFTIQIWDDGNVEGIQFADHSIVARFPISVPESHQR